jgi:hypothetical protein
MNFHKPKDAIVGKKKVSENKLLLFLKTKYAKTWWEEVLSSLELSPAVYFTFISPASSAAIVIPELLPLVLMTFT